MSTAQEQTSVMTGRRAWLVSILAVVIVATLGFGLGFLLGGVTAPGFEEHSGIIDNVGQSGIAVTDDGEQYTGLLAYDGPMLEPGQEIDFRYSEDPNIIYVIAD